ncbi:hypothetical protein F8271_08450, partial [Micromonospora sp. ALFpr18c]|uniref:hypothetical protein n=1 Tax=Micromonospora sp. ALFpr18c TaxID=1458665 RepID=UPI00124B74A7
MFPNQQQIDRQYTENLHKLCKIIFAATKDCVPVGAGNQKADLAASRGRSAYLTHLAQKSMINGRVKNLTDYLGARAAAAHGTGAGNCEDQAAVAFAIANTLVYNARQKGEIHPQVQIAFVSVPEHRFTVVGIKDNRDHQFVVDTWLKGSRVVAAHEYNFPLDTATYQWHTADGRNLAADAVSRGLVDPQAFSKVHKNLKMHPATLASFLSPQTHDEHMPAP